MHAGKDLTAVQNLLKKHQALMVFTQFYYCKHLLYRHVLYTCAQNAISVTYNIICSTINHNILSVCETVVHLPTYLQTEITSHEAYIKTVSSTGETMTTQGHYGATEIKKKITALYSTWQQLKELAQTRQHALEDALKAQQYFSDAQEAESWMKEKEPMASSVDFGKDEDSAQVSVFGGCVGGGCVGL